MKLVSHTLIGVLIISTLLLPQASSATIAEDGWCYDFASASNMRKGNSGARITALQTAFVREGFSVEVTGYFGPYTFAAVVAFQEKYAGEILTPNGLMQGNGYVGKATRGKLNELYGCTANVNTTATSTAATTNATYTFWLYEFIDTDGTVTGFRGAKINTIYVAKDGQFIGALGGSGISDADYAAIIAQLGTTSAGLGEAALKKISGKLSSPPAGITTTTTTATSTTATSTPPSRTTSTSTSPSRTTSTSTPPSQTTATTTTATGPISLNSISPNTGPAGTTVRLTFCGPDSALGYNLIYAGPKSGSEKVEVILIGGRCGYMSFAVPAGTLEGSYTLWVKNNSTGKTSVNTMSFLVIGPPLTLTSISPKFGPGGTKITLKACGLKSTSKYSLNYITLSAIAGGFPMVGGGLPLDFELTSPDCGGTTFIVPPGFPPGTYELEVKNQTTGKKSTNRVKFTLL